MQAFPARPEFPSEVAGVLMTSGGPVPERLGTSPPKASRVWWWRRGFLWYGGALHAAILDLSAYTLLYKNIDLAGSV